MTIKKQIKLVNILSIITIVALLIAGLLLTRLIGNATKTIVKGYSDVEKISELKLNLNNINYNVFRLYAGEMELNTFNASTNALVERDNEIVEELKLEDFKERLVKYRDTRNSLIAYIEKKEDVATKVLLKAFDKECDSLIEELDKIIDLNKSNINNASGKIILEIIALVVGLFLIILSTIIVIVIIITTLKKRILTGTTDLDIMSTNIENCNFAFEINPKPDSEIGISLINLKNGVENVKSMINIVINNSTMLVNKTSDFKEIGVNISEKVSTINGQLSTITGAIEELTALTEEMNISSETMVENFKKVKLTIEDANDLAEKSSKNAIKSENYSRERLVISKNLVEEKANDINRAIENIKVIEKINETLVALKQIADKSNLLSLNASLESAHAGEFGKGFSVVANEMRSLAEVSKDHAINIENTIAEVKTSVNELVNVSGELMSFINIEVMKDYELLHDISREYKVSSIDIRELFGHVNNLTNESLTNINELNINISTITGTSQEINSSIQEISASTEVTSVSVNNYLGLIESQKAMVESQNEVIKNFKV